MYKNFRQLNLATLILLSIFSFGCNNVLENQDKKTLDWFKMSSGSGLSSIIGGLEIQKCVGIHGKVEWSIYKGEGLADNLRVIQANVENKKKKAKFQWIVNIENKNYELSYAEIDGEVQRRLFLGIGLMSMCNS